MIDISFEPLLDELNKIGRSLDVKVLRKAVKAALRRTQTAHRKNAFKQSQTAVKIKAGEWNKKYTYLKRNLNTNNIDRMSIDLMVSSKTPSLIKYVRGSKSPEKQIGKPISKRRKLKVKYPSGQQSTEPDLFIAKGRGGNNIVLRRTPGTKSVGSGRSRKNPNVKAQPGPVLWVKFKKDSFRAPVERASGARLQKEFINAYRFFMDKESR